jgi:hypothetical protein
MKTALLRPTALDPATQGKIVSLLADGHFMGVACRASGITYRGLRHWQRRWEGGDPMAERFDDFFREVERASAIGEVLALARVRSGEPGWRSAAWFLGRRFPGPWGRKARAVARGVDVGRMSEEELRPVVGEGNVEGPRGVDGDGGIDHE